MNDVEKRLSSNMIKTVQCKNCKKDWIQYLPRGCTCGSHEFEEIDWLLEDLIRVEVNRKKKIRELKGEIGLYTVKRNNAVPTTSDHTYYEAVVNEATYQLHMLEELETKN